MDFNYFSPLLGINSNITTRIINWRFYTLLFLDINVSYHLQTFMNRICSFTFQNMKYVHQHQHQLSVVRRLRLTT